MRSAPEMYLKLAEDNESTDEPISWRRRLLALGFATLLLLSMPLYWASTANAQLDPVVLINSSLSGISSSSDGDDHHDDDDEPGGHGDSDSGTHDSATHDSATHDSDD